MVTSASIVNTKTNLKVNQESFDKIYLDHQVDTFKIDNAMVYQILSKAFTDTDAYIYVKLSSVIHKCFLSPDHVARKATEAERKLQNSHYDGERKTWDWDKYVAFHREQHTIMENLTDYGYNSIDNGTNVCYFLQGIKSTELQAVFNAVCAQSKKY